MEFGGACPVALGGATPHSAEPVPDVPPGSSRFPSVLPSSTRQESGGPGPRAPQPVRSARGRSPVPARWWPAGPAPAGPRPLAGAGLARGSLGPRSHARTRAHTHARTHTHATSLPASWAQRRRPGKRCFAPPLPGRACGCSPGERGRTGPLTLLAARGRAQAKQEGTFSSCCAGLPSTQIYTVFTKREVTRVHATWPPRCPTLQGPSGHTTVLTLLPGGWATWWAGDAAGARPLPLGTHGEHAPVHVAVGAPAGHGRSVCTLSHGPLAP